MEKPSHLDLTHATGCKHPRLTPEDGQFRPKHAVVLKIFKK
jgi:hypothetical protein